MGDGSGGGQIPTGAAQRSSRPPRNHPSEHVLDPEEDSPTPQQSYSPFLQQLSSGGPFPRYPIPQQQQQHHQHHFLPQQGPLMPSPQQHVTNPLQPDPSRQGSAYGGTGRKPPPVQDAEPDDRDRGNPVANFAIPPPQSLPLIEGASPPAQKAPTHPPVGAPDNLAPASIGVIMQGSMDVLDSSNPASSDDGSPDPSGAQPEPAPEPEPAPQPQEQKKKKDLMDSFSKFDSLLKRRVPKPDSPTEDDEWG